MDPVRLDVWLDVACLYRTRSEAQTACKLGKVEVNGQTAKPHRDLRPGDRLIISRPLGKKQTLLVKGLADRHIPKADARELYEDMTPAPTAEEIDRRRMERLARQFMRPAAAGAPDKRERREIRRMKRGEP